MSAAFKVGDVVDVIDRRDGTVVDSGAVISKIESESIDGGGAWREVASFSNLGYRVATRCLRHAKPESRL